MPRAPEPSAHILVLDDDETSRYLLRKVVETAGGEPSLASSAAEARGLLETQVFACALIDKNLIGEDGIDFLRSLRERQPQCSAVVVTAYGNLQSAVNALQLGACDYVLKPFDFEALAQRLRLLIERHQLLVEREHLQATLMQSDRLAALGTMAAGVVHEINNPLTSIVPGLELLVEELPRLAAEVAALPCGEGAGALAARVNRSADLVRDIKAGVEYVGQIARDVKMFARAAGPGSPLDLRAVVEAALKMVASQLRLRAQLTVEYRAVPLVVGDQTRFAQVVLNLLLNAVQATPEGQFKDHEIRVGVVGEEGAAVLEVADTAGGVAAEHVPHVFEPFFTTKRSGEGSGLGLHICRTIVESAGGTIALENRPGEGATFRMRLPVAERAFQPAPARPRLLVIAPMQAASSALRRALWSDLDLFCTTSDELALSRLQAGERFTAIVYDQTTDLASARFLAKLQERHPEGFARLLVLTRRGCEPLRAPSGESLTARCLQKPVDPLEFRQRLRTLEL